MRTSTSVAVSATIAASLVCVQSPDDCWLRMSVTPDAGAVATAVSEAIERDSGVGGTVRVGLGRDRDDADRTRAGPTRRVPGRDRGDDERIADVQAAHRPGQKDAGAGGVAQRRTRAGPSATDTSEAPANVAAVVVSNVWVGTSDVATLATATPAGSTSGSSG